MEQRDLGLVLQLELIFVLLVLAHVGHLAFDAFDGVLVNVQKHSPHVSAGQLVYFVQRILALHYPLELIMVGSEVFEYCLDVCDGVWFQGHYLHGDFGIILRQYMVAVENLRV